MRRLHAALPILVALTSCDEQEPQRIDRAPSTSHLERRPIVLASASAVAHPWTPVGCKLPFPSAGTRFTQTSISTLQLPATFRDTFMISREDTGRQVERIAFRIDAVDDHRIATERELARSAEGTRGDGTIDPNPGSINFRDGSSASRIASIARATREPTALVSALAAFLNLEIKERDKVTIASPTVSDSMLVYPVVVRRRRGEAATCHALSLDESLAGTMTLRAFDAALVEIRLRGTMTFVESLCAWGPDGEPHEYKPVHAPSSLTIARDCFR